MDRPPRNVWSKTAFKRAFLLLLLATFASPLSARAEEAANKRFNGSFQTQEEIYHQQAKDPQHADVHAVGTVAKDLSFFQKLAPPDDFTSFGHRIDWLFRYTSWVAFGFFLLMAGSLLFFVIRYRERPGHKALYTKGTDHASTRVTRMLDLAVFVTLDAVLLVASFRDSADIIWAYPKSADVVKVMVMPQQWSWNFRYAGKDGVFNTPDDIVTINEMRVPKDKPILIQIKSKDVIHGFFIPNARIQIDAIPGQVSRLWFDANRTGIYEIACFHLCGTAHYKMKAFLQVMEPDDFRMWSEESSAWSAARFDPEDKQTQWGWDWGI
jgi:cytochrome c oxidase subunit 2